MNKIINNIKNEYLSKNRMVLITYLILNIIVMIFLVKGIFDNNIKDTVFCIVTLILFLVPTLMCIKFKIKFASILEVMLYILVFTATILGEVLSFYIHIKIFDIILHFLYGFVLTGVGLSLIYILNLEVQQFSKKFIILFSICYSMFAGVTWEIYEYGVDKIFNQDMQKDTIITEISSVKLNDNGNNISKTIVIDTIILNGEDYTEKYGGYIDIGLNDTMKDIIINLIGAIFFSLFTNRYLKSKSIFVTYFMIRKDKTYARIDSDDSPGYLILKTSL